MSGLEMAQNSQRLKWTAEEVDEKLKGIMEACFNNCLETAKLYVQAAEDEFPSLVAGANIAGFSKVSSPESRDNYRYYERNARHKLISIFTRTGCCCNVRPR